MIISFISVIIPTLNEEQTILRVIDVLHSNAGGYVNEVIVVDGGSNDKTIEKVEQRGVILIKTNFKCIAKQLNLGAKRATNKLLYFLYADTLPPVGFDVLIAKSFQRGVLAGSFNKRYDFDHKLLRICSFYSRYNFMICRSGNRSIFVLKEAFDLIQGFSETEIMEDYELITGLSKYIEFSILPQKVIVSSRGYQKIGVWKLIFAKITRFIFYKFGIRNGQLKNLYLRLIK